MKSLGVVKGIGVVSLLLLAPVLGCERPQAEPDVAEHTTPAPAVGLVQEYEQAKRETMCVEAQQLAGAVEMHLAIDPGECPADVATLVEARLLPRVPDTSKSWTIACDGVEVIVSAPGPDERMGTADDVVAGGPRDTCTKK